MKQEEWKVLAVDALVKSIAHWNRHATDTALPGEGIRSSDCECCNVFLDGREYRDRHRCLNCPVALRTGRVSCLGTPYGTCVTVGSQKLAHEASRFRASAVDMRDWLKDTLTLVRNDKLTCSDTTEAAPTLHNKWGT